MEPFQIGQQKKTQRHVGRPDRNFTAFQVLHLRQPLFPGKKCAIPFFHIFVQDFSFRRQADSTGAAHKQAAAEGLFQLPDALADRRLGQGKCCRRLCH